MPNLKPINFVLYLVFLVSAIGTLSYCMNTIAEAIAHGQRQVQLLNRPIQP